MVDLLADSLTVLCGGIYYACQRECMMIPKIYLETSVFNFVFADDAPDKREDTKKLFQEIKNNAYCPFTSVYVTEEIERASYDRKKRMYRLFHEYNVEALEKSDEIECLADAYINEGIIPSKYRTDALHIATATVNMLDIVVSWNFKHIVKRKTIIMTENVNLRNGYKKMEIYSPAEVIENV